MNKTILLILIVIFFSWTTNAEITIPDFPVGERIMVYPVIFLPKDAHLTIPQKTVIGRKIQQHLKISQNLYLKLLKTDTFSYSEEKITLYQSSFPNKYFAEIKAQNQGQSAYRILQELLTRFGENRFNTNRVYLVIYKRPANKPYDAKFNLFGGGRTLNGLPNSGGGYIELEYQSLLTDKPYPFQSTLDHELGHAFGLTHSNCLGYSLSESDSIMSYNVKHHSKGLTSSKTPGILLAEEQYVLSLNQRVFPNFAIDPKQFKIQDKSQSQIEKCFLGPMTKELGTFKRISGMGYELYFNKQLVSGPEAGYYSLLQAKQNCSWNLKHQKNIDVYCTYNQKPILP